MPSTTALIAGWARSPVAPYGGALSRLQPHEIAAPVLQALLARAGVPASAVDAVVVGNALGAGGNPARMLALAAGLPEACAAFSVDTQCCAGLDAVAMAVGLLASGQASVVVAGGVEAWSRAPIRMHRPRHTSEPAVAYERPAFAPDPDRDPDLLVAAAHYALAHGWTRQQQDAYALRSHRNALQHQAALADEIVPVAGLQADSHPRDMPESRVARMPAAIKMPGLGAEGRALLHSQPDCTLSRVAISAKADGAALVLLATPDACRQLRIRPQARWVASASVGGDPRMPLVAAEQATRAVLKRAGLDAIDTVRVIELHDAFAVQGLSFCAGLGVDPARLNRRGGGLARGHPIGASAGIA
ncbi:MAG: acetyl-CoA acetyltransferase, partial [Rhodoferax sp.]|nr:acetyl-CoA acetyltransferase [Rhodoferax sp.]